MVIALMAGIIIIAALTVVIFLRQPSFGRLPKGERLERIRHSPHYHNGKFNNLRPTPLMTSGKGRLETMWQFLFSKKEGLYPDTILPVVKTDLRTLS